MTATLSSFFRNLAFLNFINGFLTLAIDTVGTSGAAGSAANPAFFFFFFFFALKIFSTSSM
jgi:hypothetical protein